MNSNKLLPRTSIKAKLAVAFGVVAAVPLLLVGLLVMGGIVRRLVENAEIALDHQVELATLGVLRPIQEAERHVAIIEDAFVGGAPNGDISVDSRAATRIARTLLSADSSALVRVAIVDSLGRNLLLAQRPAPPAESASALDALAYVEAARTAGTEWTWVFPLPSVGTGNVTLEGSSAAVLHTMRDSDGRTVGLTVGEVPLASLFGPLSLDRSGNRGSSGLVGPDGGLLFHTTWSPPPEATAPVDPVSDPLAELGSELAEEVLSGRPGRTRTSTHLASFRPIPLTGTSVPLTLYRVVPLEAVRGSLAYFAGIVAILGAAILVTVLSVSAVAADQFTRPIYELRSATRLLATGQPARPIQIHTNDELEELARDFSEMARSLEDHRRNLEAMVEARTRALAATRAHLDQVVGHAADAVVALDRDGKVTLWNPAAERLFGFTEVEARGVPIQRLVGPAATHRSAEETFLQRELAESRAVVALRTLRTTRSGEELPVSLTQSHIVDKDGAVVGYSLIIRDARAEQLLEEQMRRSERLAAVSVMAAGLAHEINNPLAILGNRIELMQRELAAQPDPERVRADLDVLRAHVERIGRLTTDLLAFAREDTEGDGTVDLHQVVDRVTRLLRRNFQRKGVELVTTEESRVPPMSGNEKAIETVFVNLLLNAASMTPEGGVVEVVVGQASRPGYVRWEVRDTGPGVARELRGRIFEPFFTTRAADGGTGLGLTVCRSVVERHGGSIRASEREGFGGCFVVELPVRAARGEAPARMGS